MCGTRVVGGVLLRSFVCHDGHGQAGDIEAVIAHVCGGGVGKPFVELCQFKIHGCASGKTHAAVGIDSLVACAGGEYGDRVVCHKDGAVVRIPDILHEYIFVAHVFEHLIGFIPVVARRGVGYGEVGGHDVADMEHAGIAYVEVKAGTTEDQAFFLLCGHCVEQCFAGFGRGLQRCFGHTVGGNGFFQTARQYQ